MSAIFNNIHTLTLQELEELRNMDSLDPFAKYCFDVEYRLRVLEGHVFEKYPDEDAEVISVDEIVDEEEVEEIEETTSVEEVFATIGKYNLVEDEDMFRYASDEDGTLLTPDMDSEEALISWVIENAEYYKDKTIETFTPFWEE